MPSCVIGGVSCLQNSTLLHDGSPIQWILLGYSFPCIDDTPLSVYEGHWTQWRSKYVSSQMLMLEQWPHHHHRSCPPLCPFKTEKTNLLLHKWSTHQSFHKCNISYHCFLHNCCLLGHLMKNQCYLFGHLTKNTSVLNHHLNMVFVWNQIWYAIANHA